MRRLSLSLVSLSVVGALIGLVAPAHADGTYAPGLPTSCHVDLEAQAGERVVVDVEVTANSTEPTTGQVEVVLSKGSATARSARSVGPRAVWTTTERYEGEPLRLVGPRIGAGQYVVELEFTPDSSEFSGCTAMASVRSSNVGGTDDGPDAGGLPNTGGPHLLILLAGLGLVAAGGGFLTRGRRNA